MPMYAHVLKDKNNFNAGSIIDQESVSAGLVIRLVASVWRQPIELLSKEEFCCNIATD